MGEIVVNAFLSYLKSHPEVLQRLIEQLVKAVLDHAAPPAQ